MSTLIRHKTYQMQGEDTSLRLKKWSVIKYVTLTKEIAEIVKEFGQSWSAEEVGDVQKMAGLVMTLGDAAQVRITRIIRESVDDPADLGEEQILEWDPEDFLGVLTAIFEMNISDTLVKNLKSLQTTFQKKFGTKVPGRTQSKPQKKSNEEPTK